MNFSSLLPDLAADLFSRYAKHTWQESVSHPRSYSVVHSDHSLDIHEAKITTQRLTAWLTQSPVTPSRRENTVKQAGCCFISRIIILCVVDRYEWAAELNKSQWSEWNMLFYNCCTKQSLVSDEPNWTTGDLLQTMVNLLELEIKWWHWSQNHNHTSGETPLVPSGRDLNTKAPRFSCMKGEQPNNLHITKETTKPQSPWQVWGRSDKDRPSWQPILSNKWLVIGEFTSASRDWKLVYNPKSWLKGGCSAQYFSKTFWITIKMNDVRNF